MIDKITYITNNPMPTGRAYGNQIAKLCEALANFGIAVDLIYLGSKDTSNSDFFSYFSVKENFTLKPIIFFNFLKLERYIGKISFYLQGLVFLVRLLFLKITKDSIVYTRQSEIAWLMTLRGFTTYYEDHGGINKNNFLFLKFLKRVRGIVAINSFIKNEFVKNGIDGNKVLVAPSGVDLNNFDIDVSREDAIKCLNLERRISSDLNNKKILLYTGNFKTKGVDKGIDEILKATSLLKDLDLVFLAVGGSIEEINFYRQMALNIGLSNAFFLSRQSQEKLALYQKAADILLMPFPDKAHYKYFMSPVKMFEYMASKKPIIASNLPSIKDVLNDKNALLVREGDSEDLARGIRDILNNKQLVQNLVANAFEDVRGYSWQERVRKILNFMKNEKIN